MSGRQHRAHPDFKVRVIALAKQRVVGEREETDLVQRLAGIRVSAGRMRSARRDAHVTRVADQLAQENVFVAVQRVDEDVHEARDLRLELILLSSLAQLVAAAARMHGRRRKGQALRQLCKQRNNVCGSAAQRGGASRGARRGVPDCF